MRHAAGGPRRGHAACGGAHADAVGGWPEIELDLDFTDRLVDVIDEGFDAVIRTGEARDSRLMTRVLGSYDLKLVGAPAYFAAHGIPESPGDLAGHRCLRQRFPTTGRLEDWLPDPGDPIELRTAATSNTIEPLVCLAERGLGIACLPDFAVRAQIEAGTLMSVLDSAVHRCGTFRILWPSSRQLAPKIRVFVDFMAENLFAPP